MLGGGGVRRRTPDPSGTQRREPGQTFGPGRAGRPDGGTAPFRKRAGTAGLAAANGIERGRLSGAGRAVAAALTAALLVVACSSLPKGSSAVDTVKNQAAQYASQGNAYYERGDYVQAEKYFRLALDADFSVDHRAGISSSYTSLGRVYLAAGDLKAAGAAFAKAIQYAAPAATPEEQTLVVAARTGQAEILLVQGSYQAALELLKKTEALPAPADTSEHAALLHDLGGAYKGLENYPMALSYLNEALAAHTKLKLVALQASDLYMIASVYSKQKDYASATDYARRALAADKLVENSVGIGADLRALGIIAEKQGKLPDAYQNYYASLQVFRTLGIAPDVRDLLGRLETVARAMGKSREAADYASALKQMGAAK